MGRSSCTSCNGCVGLQTSCITLGVGGGGGGCGCGTLIFVFILIGLVSEAQAWVMENIVIIGGIATLAVMFGMYCWWNKKKSYKVSKTYNSLDELLSVSKVVQERNALLHGTRVNVSINNIAFDGTFWTAGTTNGSVRLIAVEGGSYTFEKDLSYDMTFDCFVTKVDIIDDYVRIDLSSITNIMIRGKHFVKGSDAQ